MIIGITGGIACGKSTVTKIFGERGAFVIDHDGIGHQLLDDDTSLIDRLVSEFGGEILDDNKKISREKLGKLAFADNSLRQKLNAIMHPLILARSDKLAKRSMAIDQSRLVAIDSPLLIEANYHKKVDFIVVVATEREIQIQRVIDRENVKGRPSSAEAVQQRIEAQMPLSEKIHYANFVIKNSGSMAQLNAKVDRCYEKIINYHLTLPVIF